MKFYKTIVLAILAVVTLGGAYYWTVLAQSQRLEKEELSKKIMNLDPEQVNYIEVQNKDKKIVLQKKDKDWFIEEPIPDAADNIKIKDILEKLNQEKSVAVVKDQTHSDSDGKPVEKIDWSEFQLEQPESVIILKTAEGKSQKIQISQLKNFEGYNYAKIDSVEKVLIINPQWYNLTTEKLVGFREKRLYRGPIENIKKITVKSLHDEFKLVENDKTWSPLSDQINLDQDKVRDLIRNITESTIQDYVEEGEPSEAQKSQFGLKKDFVQFKLETLTDSWSVIIGLSELDKSLYALTDKPTFLVKLDLSKWEQFGNLNLDSLRDRKKNLTFDISKVNKAFIKNGTTKYDLVKENKKWKSTNNNLEINDESISQLIDQVHNLEISYFLPDSQQKNFSGTDMIILKGSDDQLLFQMNWGPQEKDYYLARTQSSDSIFGLKKSYIDSLNLDNLKKVVK